MNYLITFLILCLCSGCATHHTVNPKPVAAVVADSKDDEAEVETPDTVKAYPVGRYSDPNDPDVMHERHTLYRREESADWNYQPNAPYALPLARLGPTATSNPSPSYYEQADEEEINAQQRAYAEALQEENRAIKKRLESLQQDAGKVPGLEQEIDRLKKQLDAMPVPQPPAKPSQPEPSESSQEDGSAFSSQETHLSDEEITLITQNTR
jgi:hypothetical protein